MALKYITVSQAAEEQAFLAKNIDGAATIIAASQGFAGLGTAIAPGLGTIIGLGVGVVVGIITAIFGDQKKGAMNTYRVIVAEVLAQFGEEDVHFNGERAAVWFSAPADSAAMLELCKESIRAIRDNFSVGSDDYNDCNLALNSIRVEDYPTGNNTTIVYYSELENGNPITSILHGSNGGLVLLAIGAFFLSNK